MPKLKSTKSALDKLNLTPIGQIDYWDTELSGIGLRVGKETTSMVKADVKMRVADISKNHIGQSRR